jgi:hypothetical protein
MLAVAVGFTSSLRMWLQASRQLSSFVRSIVEILKKRSIAFRVAQSRDAGNHAVTDTPFALVWLGLMIMLLASLQRVCILLILVDGYYDQDHCADVDVCSPCDSSCRRVSEVLSNWILLDPRVLGVSSLVSECLTSAIMVLIQLWLASKGEQGRKSHKRAATADDLQAEPRFNSQLFGPPHTARKEEGEDVALGMLLQLGHVTPAAPA